MIVSKVEDKNVFGKTVNIIHTTLAYYDLGMDNCTLRYVLGYRDPNRESPAIPDTPIYSGEWKVPTEITDNWTGANSYLAEELIKDLDFTLIEHLDM
jgi:hypothetical protein